jgi:acetyltransferase-like isoleucine patch superfamily enzyme
MIQIVKKIGMLALRIYYRIAYKNVRFGSNSKIKWGSIFGGFNFVGNNSTFFGKIGHDSYIGKDCLIYAEIGNYTSIGDNVKCIFASHPIEKFVSSSPVFYSTLKQNGHTYVDCQKYNEVLLQDKKNVPCIIGNDVWIGTNVLIIGKVTIGDGAVLAAGSVVTKDVQPYSIVAGVPAKEARRRFDDQTIMFLLETQWWNKDAEWIKNNADAFDDIENLKKLLK